VKDSLRRYKIDQKTWDVAPIPGRPTCFTADSNHVAIGLVWPAGALSVRALDEKQWRPLEGAADLPNIVNTLTVDGSDLFAAGHAFVAAFDLNQNKLRKVTYVAVDTWTQHCLQTGGGFLWAMFKGHLYRVPLGELK
jgi:hypothetical protein